MRPGDFPASAPLHGRAGEGGWRTNRLGPTRPGDLLTGGDGPPRRRLRSSRLDARAGLLGLALEAVALRGAAALELAQLLLGGLARGQRRGERLVPVRRELDDAVARLERDADADQRVALGVDGALAGGRLRGAVVGLGGRRRLALGGRPRAAGRGLGRRLARRGAAAGGGALRSSALLLVPVLPLLEVVVLVVSAIVISLSLLSPA